jgi:RNA 3'-terminal phosphate cyclase
LEWLKSHKTGEVGGVPLVSSKKEKSLALLADRPVEVYEVQSQKKVGGVLNHNVHCLKKVARLSGNDPSEVLKLFGNKNGNANGNSVCNRR